MPNYNAALTTSLWVGSTKTVADSTLITPFTTVAIAVGPDPSGAPESVTVYNPSALVATVQVAASDADANYMTYSTAPAGQATQIPVSAQFVRLSFPSAPASAVTIGR